MSFEKKSAFKKGYTKQWDRARKVYLFQHPLCCMCQKEDKLTSSTVVDHIRPHRGDMTLFWDRHNWQALCAFHHNSTKQRQDHGRLTSPIGEDGWPVT